MLRCAALACMPSNLHASAAALFRSCHRAVTASQCTTCTALRPARSLDTVRFAGNRAADRGGAIHVAAGTLKATVSQARCCLLLAALPPAVCCMPLCWQRMPDFGAALFCPTAPCVPHAVLFGLGHCPP